MYSVHATCIFVIGFTRARTCYVIFTFFFLQIALPLSSVVCEYENEIIQRVAHQLHLVNSTLKGKKKHNTSIIHRIAFGVFEYCAFFFFIIIMLIQYGTLCSITWRYENVEKPKRPHRYNMDLTRKCTFRYCRVFVLRLAVCSIRDRRPQCSECRITIYTLMDRCDEDSMRLG